MTMHYQTEKPAIHRAMQVWVCDTCGVHDNKSCGCDSTAHAEAMAAKREATRQRVQKHRETKKANENNDRVTRYNEDDESKVEELPPEICAAQTQSGWCRHIEWRAAKSAEHARAIIDRLPSDLIVDGGARKAIAGAVKYWTQVLNLMETGNAKDKAA